MYRSRWKKSKKLRKENQEAKGHVVIVKNLCVALDVATKSWNLSMTRNTAAAPAALRLLARPAGGSRSLRSLGWLASLAVIGLASLASSFKTPLEVCSRDKCGSLRSRKNLGNSKLL